MPIGLAYVLRFASLLRGVLMEEGSRTMHSGQL